MAQTVIRFQLDARVDWRISRDSHGEGWIGVCPALKVTAEADTWGEMCQVINEIHNELFRDLLQEGELQSFLTQQGWRPLTPIPMHSQAGNLVFDIPAHMMPANDRAREIHQ